MTNQFILSASVAAAAILAGSPLLADVTAQQVWENWRTSMEVYGEGNLTIGSENATEGELVVSDIVLTIKEDETTITSRFDSVTFVENGDGTVNVVLPETSPLVISGADDTVVTISVNQTDASLRVSGTADAMDYAIAASRYSLVVDSIVGEDGPIEADMFLNFNDVAGAYTLAEGDLLGIVYDISAESIDFLVDAVDPDGESGQIIVSGKVDGLELQANMQLPVGSDFQNPETMFADGFDVDLGYRLGAAAYIFDLTDASGQSTGTATVSDSTFAIAMNADRMDYDVEVNNIALDLNAAQLPFPISVVLADYDVGLKVPLSASDTPSPFSFLVNLGDLSINDEIWAMVDPAGQLSHDPATVRLDLSGTGMLDANLLDPAQMEAVEDAEVPGTLESLTLNDLTLALSGALLTGEGAFTFDNTDLTTFNGVPRPLGEVTFNLTGGNALLDKLVNLGVLPAEQAMMARMGIGMFARSVGDDELTSTIEVNEAGEVSANGQRLR